MSLIERLPIQNSARSVTTFFGAARPSSGSREDGFGPKQERERRFSLGVRGAEAPDLRRWIKPAALLLPAAESAEAPA